MNYLIVFKNAAIDWSHDKASVWAASLAYFTVFSLSPLLLLLTAVIGIFFGEEAIHGQLFNQIQGFVGKDAAAVIEKAVSNTTKPGGNILSAIISVATLIIGATGIFDQLQQAFNSIWKVTATPKAGISVFIKDKLLSFSMLVIIGFLLAISLGLSTAVNIATNYFHSFFNMPIYVLELVNFVVSFIVLGILFVAMFKVLPDVRVPYKAAIPGAILTSILFVIGKSLIALYIGRSAYTSTYGAAGSLMVILVWVYYSIQIVLFGAEFTKSYASVAGIKIAPSHNAVSIGELEKKEPTEKKVATTIGYIMIGISSMLYQRFSNRETPKKKK